MFSVAGQLDGEGTRKDVADHAVPNFGAKGDEMFILAIIG